MNLELFIARKIRFNKGKENSKATPPAVRIAIIGVALGLTVMILAVAVIIGFKKEVREKVIGFGSHIQIANFDNNISYETAPITISDTLLNDLSTYPGIKHLETYATKPGMLKTNEDFQGIVFKGIDVEFDWSFFKSNLKEGDLPVITADSTSSEVLISRYLSRLLKLNTGDSFITYFMQESIRPRRFHIKGIYDSGFSDYDKYFIIGDIKQVQRINGWEKNQASGIELLVADYDNLDQTSENLYFHLIKQNDREGNMFFTRSIKDLNPGIFAWLDALDVNVAVILILIVIVAGFTIISGLLIIILERTNMIGLLKAMGQRDSSIRKIFLYISFFMIGKGMIWGNIIGISICIIQHYFKVIPLNPEDYYLDAVPIELSIPMLLLINAGTLFISMTMMLAPSYIIAKIEPSKSIRFE